MDCQRSAFPWYGSGIRHLPLSSTFVGAVASLEAWVLVAARQHHDTSPCPISLPLADECIPGEWFGRLESLMSDGLSPQLKHEGCFQVLCVCCEGSGRRAQEGGRPSDGLISGPTHFWALAGMTDFPKYYFFGSRGGPPRWCRQDMLCMPLRCTDTWRSPRIGHIRVIVCVGVFCMRGCIASALARRSPCSVPTGYPTKVAGMENAMASCAALPGVRVRAGVCVWAGGGNCAQSRGANRSQSEETATANSQVKQARPWLLKSIVDMWSVVEVGLLGF